MWRTIYVALRNVRGTSLKGLFSRFLDAPTLNTSIDSARLFKVLSVEMFDLCCVSTADTRPRLKRRRPSLN